MHLYLRMACLLPIQQMIIDENNRLPEGQFFVITNTNNFVVTNTGANVIAKTP